MECDLAMALIDVEEAWPVRQRTQMATGRVESFVEDEIETPDGTMTRQYATHPGAVAIMAMDDQCRIAVVHQYRHPVGMRLVEPPAGLLDVDGEDYLAAAKRELAEEAQLAAETWRVLIDVCTSPGGLEESLRIYLATDLSSAPRPEGFVVEDEEVDMGLHWVPLDELVTSIYAGDIHSPSMISGALALAHALDHQVELRPADAPWPAQEIKVRQRAEAHE